MMTSMTQKMLPRRVDGFGNIIVPDYPSVEALMKIGNPENTRHHGHLMDLMQSAYDGKDDVEDMMYAMNDMHGGAWYDDLLDGIKDVGKFLWDNKSDIINVAKAVAPLFGGGMEFDDAYEDVVGGAVSRYAHTLSELKHFTFPALQAYIAKINKHFKNKTSNVPKSEKKYINGIRKLKNLRLRQRKQSTKLFEKGEKTREKYMSSHKTSLGLMLPRHPSRKSGYMSRAEAREINLDLAPKNKAALAKAKKELDKATYETLLSVIDEFHKEGKTRPNFNKAVKAELLVHGFDVGATKAKPRAQVVIAKAPAIAPVPVPVAKPSKKTSMATGPNVLGKANKAALELAKLELNPGQYQNLLREIKVADERAKNSLNYNKLVKIALVANGISVGQTLGREKPSYSKPSTRDYKFDHGYTTKLDELGNPFPPPPPDYEDDDYIYPPPPDYDDDEFEPPPVLNIEKRATGRPRRRTTRKKSTRKPTKKSKKSKKSRKVRLI